MKIRDINRSPTGESELYMPIKLKELTSTLSNDKEKRYLTECNEEFLEETGLIKILRGNDIYLRPSNVAMCNYDIYFGSENVCTPFRYDIKYRNYYLVTEGEVRLMIAPPKSGKYIFKDLDYENMEFRSPINPWDVQDHYKQDFDKVKCLEIVLKRGDLLYMPAYWWHSLKYSNNATVIGLRYSTYMNLVAILPELGLHLLQNQNIKRIIAPKLDVNDKRN